MKKCSKCGKASCACGGRVKKGKMPFKDTDNDKMACGGRAKKKKK